MINEGTRHNQYEGKTMTEGKVQLTNFEIELWKLKSSKYTHLF